MNKDLKVIAFDADDTLWHNEGYFQEMEQKCWELLENYLPQHSAARELMRTEMQNIQLYGYGIKAFTLSMIETAIRISSGTVPITIIEQIISYGKELLGKPVKLIDGVEEVLKALQGKYRLVVSTKGDLLDQQRKLTKSGLEGYFHHIEIVSEKNEPEYTKLVRHLDIAPQEFAMIGNSLKSDIIPVLNIGGHGFHIPYHITWVHERVDTQIEHENFRELSSIGQVLDYV